MVVQVQQTLHKFFSFASLCARHWKNKDESNTLSSAIRPIVYLEKQVHQQIATSVV
jgi:hypothetical protein